MTGPPDLPSTFRPGRGLRIRTARNFESAAADVVPAIHRSKRGANVSHGSNRRSPGNMLPSVFTDDNIIPFAWL